MRRGDLVTTALSGDYGKPRPALVIQSDLLSENESVLVCLVTSSLLNSPRYRVLLTPSPTNGLRSPSQLMVDKIVSVRREKCGAPIGRIDDLDMQSFERLLVLMLGLAD